MARAVRLKLFADLIDLPSGNWNELVPPRNGQNLTVSKGKTLMNTDQFNQYDAQYLHQQVAKELGITADELKTWMINDIERVTEGGKDVGHMVVFRESTPPEILDKLQHRQSQFTAMTGVIPRDQS